MRRFIVFLSSLGVCLIAGLAAVPGFADDTEVYKNQVVTDVSSDASRPNILFVLDRSSSMAYYEYAPDGTKLYGSTKRIERLTEALLQVLDSPTLDKANIGLATFSSNSASRGAAINFPIADVNSAATDIFGEQDLPPQLNIPVAQSSDDAEETQSSGKVVVDRSQLEMVTTLPPDMKKETIEVYTTVLTSPLTIPDLDKSSRIYLPNQTQFDKTAYNVGRELLGGSQDPNKKPAGTMCFGFGSNWLGGGGSSKPADTTSPLWGDGIVGLRFAGFNIPKGATILDASVEFSTASYPNSGKTVDLMIHGVANPPPFTISTGTNKSKTVVPLVVKNTDMCSDVLTPDFLSKNGATSTLDQQLFQLAPTKQITSSWPKTENFVHWTSDQVGTWPKDGKVATTDLSAVVQEVVDKNKAASQDTTSIGFRFVRSDHDPTFNSTAYDMNTGRQFLGLDNWAQSAATATQMPKLKITYTMDPPENQTVGLRFQSVRIVQGAKIRSAVIQFTSGDSKASAANLTIQAEKTGDAATFTTADNNISSRATTTALVKWNVPAWTKGQNYTSPELKDVVQEVVNQTDWCGGNSMAFMVGSDKTGLRNALSYDYIDPASGGDTPNLSPVLKVEYEIDKVNPNACVKSLFTTSVKSSVDDAEEELRDQSGSPTGTLYLKDITGAMEIGTYETPRMIGVRFNSIPIAKNSKILKAELIINGKTDTENAASIKAASFSVTGDLSADSKPFGVVTGTSYSNDNFELSKRPKTGAVKWTIDTSTPWITGKTYTSPNLQSIVQAIVNQGGWAANNNMSLFIEGTGVRKTFAYENNPAKSVGLRIEVLGPLATATGSVYTTVRDRLKEKVLQMENGIGGSTNLVPAAYEVAQYFTGGKVVYGSSRYVATGTPNDTGWINSQVKNMSAADAAKEWANFYAHVSKHRVSHPGSYSGGRAVIPEGCTSADPWSPNCAGEKIDGDPVYIKPKDAKCAGNYVIFLTDGSATINGAKENVQRLIGGSCAASSSTGTKFTDFELCGADVIKFMNTKANVTVHTIGFSLGTSYTDLQLDAEGKAIVPNVHTKKWIKDERMTAINDEALAYLKEWAKQGKGNFHEASSVGELVSAFTDIVASAIVDSTSYAAPSVSVNAFNRISHNNEIYFAIFKPGQTPLWDGNVKKFYVCDGSEGDCVEGDILDKYRQSAVDAVARNIKETATSVWSTEPDGMLVTKGSAGEILSNMISSRKIFTYTGDENTNAGTNHALDLDTSDNTIVWSNKKLTKQLLLGQPGATQAAVDSAMSDEQHDDLINWIRGNDRWPFGDPLHSSPVAVTFGGSEKNPLTYLFVGTNDGLIRMIDAKTGKEEWAFLPPELLPIQQTLKKNEANGERIYGIDGTPTYWMVDKNNNGIIESGDSVYLYVPMRSGGRNIYALDVTSPKKPKFMWVIKGGVGVDNAGKPRDSTKACPDGSSNCTPGYEHLGLTWSSPKPTRMKMTNCADGKPSCVALVFGGGYNNGAEHNDSSTYLKSGCTSNIANAVYIADATTGKRLWWASNSGSGADLVLSGMNCEIPSDIGMYDDNADGSPDSFYFGDLGGNIWRIDLNDGTGSGAGKKSLGAKLAALSDGTVTGKRQFFYPPEVIRVRDTVYSAEEDYRLVTVTSGTRPNPLNQLIQNQFYALRDRAVDGLVDNNNDGSADMDTRGAAPVSKFYTLSLVDLQDVTNDVLQTELNAKIKAGQDGTNYTGNYEAKVKELQDKKGWFLNLQDATTKAWKGEKGLASPVIMDGKVFFTTYTPVSELSVPQGDSCTTTFSDGTSKLYALDIFMGGSAYNFSDAKPGEEAKVVNGKDVLGDAADRSKNIKPGLTTDIQFRIPKNGRARPMTNDPLLGKELSVENPLTPTFWMQE
jgi:type IV pilus assembly protein PilY1